MNTEYLLYRLKILQALELFQERLEKLKIQNYAIQYILMSESTVYNLIV